MRSPLLCITGIGFLLAGLIIGCGGSSQSERVYPIKGKVVEVGVDRVTLDHEAIPGYMGAMQMSFPVAKPDLLSGIKPGDQVQGRLNASSGQAVLDELKKN